MEGKASIQIGHVNDQEKQKVSLTYYLGSFDSVKDAQAAKFAIDKIAEEYGAEIHDGALIIDEKATKDARKDADTVVEAIEEK